VRRLGLRARLTAVIAVIIVIASGATFVAIYRGTGARLRSQIDHELRADVEAFARSGVPAGRPSPAMVERALGAYVRAQPFTGSSHVLSAVVPGAGVVSNQPELLGLVREPHEPATDQAAERRGARALLHARVGYSHVRLPDVGAVRVLTQDARRAGRAVARLSIAEPLEPVRRAQHGIARTFVLAGSLTLAAALIASYLVALGLVRPLRRIAATARRVNAGDLTPRIHAGGPHDEVRVLADALDHMLDRLEGAFVGQRQFLADASHELRSPLTVIRGQLEVLSRQPNVTSEDVARVERLVRIEVERMQRLVDDLLLLTHSAEPEFVDRRPLELEPFVHELFDGLRATADRRFELDLSARGTIAADHDRLAQAVRNLTRNAIEHTREGGLVRLQVRGFDGRVSFAVEDDGPGIPADQRALIFDRLHRLDRARTRSSGGTGLGLAIVQAIAEAHGGSVLAGVSPEGGARIGFELPRHEPAAGEAGTPAPR
jgi:two-component system OmpR family sensor kinase